MIFIDKNSHETDLFIYYMIHVSIESHSMQSYFRGNYDLNIDIKFRVCIRFFHTSYQCVLMNDVYAEVGDKSKYRCRTIARMCLTDSNKVSIA